MVYHLATKPEIQEKLRSEIEEVCGKGQVCFLFEFLYKNFSGSYSEKFHSLTNFLTCKIFTA
jgi:hypothetical protein